MINTWYENKGYCTVHPNRMGDDIEVKLCGVSEHRIKKPHSIVWELSGKSGDLVAWRFVEPKFVEPKFVKPKPATENVNVTLTVNTKEVKLLVEALSAAIQYMEADVTSYSEPEPLQRCKAAVNPFLDL